MASGESTAPRRAAAQRTIWRWHFYAGLFCLPFVLWLAATGAIYLFKPQIEARLERGYENLPVDGASAAPHEQVAAALAAVPGATLNAYELPRTPQSAVRVLVGRGSELTRVYVHPQTAQVLGAIREEDRFMRQVFRLHGELMLGPRGSWLVELAACWAIVMLATGLYLWWPRSARGLAGVVYPRLGAGGRTFWRDLHAVTGLWVSAFALFLLLSGLPWANFWGGYLKALRTLGDGAVVEQDWTTSRAEERARHLAANTPPAGHEGHAMAASGPQALPGTAGTAYVELDRLVAPVAALRLAPPVLIAPPSRAAASWTARSDAANRPQRVNLTLDGERGTIVRRVDFRERPLLDRIVGTGVAAHEGQLFGWPNQLLGLLTALGLATLCVSAATLWWRRRPAGVLGAPPPSGARVAPSLIALALIFALLFPLLGASMLAVWLLEALLLRRLGATRRFMGLADAR